MTTKAILPPGLKLWKIWYHINSNLKFNNRELFRSPFSVGLIISYESLVSIARFLFSRYYKYIYFILICMLWWASIEQKHLYLEIQLNEVLGRFNATNPFTFWTVPELLPVSFIMFLTDCPWRRNLTILFW